MQNIQGPLGSRDDVTATPPVALVCQAIQGSGSLFVRPVSVGIKPKKITSKF